MASASGLEKLVEADELLARVVRLAHQIADEQFRVAEVSRSVEKQLEAMAAGTSKVKNAYNSKHVIGPKRKFAEAVDLYPRGKRIDLNNVESYRVIEYAMKSASKQLGIPVDWGWDLWHWDAPHWQLRT